MTSRVWVIGGTSGIGEAVVEACNALDDVEAFATDEEDGNVRLPYQLSQVISGMRPTHVVYSAGDNDLCWIKDSTQDRFLNLLSVNVVGFQSLLQALLGFNSPDPYSVVAISSDAASRPMRTSLMYCASKAALNMAVKCAARELASEGWRINAVAPGKVADTGMTDYVDRTVPRLRGWTPKYALDYELASSPIGRCIDKGEVARVVVDVLFGPMALNGAIVPVNGGR